MCKCFSTKCIYLSINNYDIIIGYELQLQSKETAGAVDLCIRFRNNQP